MGKLIIYYSRRLKTTQSVLFCLQLGSKAHFPQFSEIFASFKSLAKETSDNLNKGGFVVVAVSVSFFVQEDPKKQSKSGEPSLLGLRREETVKESSAQKGRPTSNLLLPFSNRLLVSTKDLKIFCKGN